MFNAKKKTYNYNVPCSIKIKYKLLFVFRQKRIPEMSFIDHRSSKDTGSDQTFDYMFKILIIGNSSVGKTSFLFRYADDSFTNAFVSTVGIDFKVKTIVRQDKRIKLQIWDTAGQERYRTITTAYYRGAMGFLLMYDVTNEESFNAVQDWCTQIKMYSWDNAQVVLVGNKCDLEEYRVITYERGRLLAEQLGMEFFETSAKENTNVKAVFDSLVCQIVTDLEQKLYLADSKSRTKIEVICNRMSDILDHENLFDNNRLQTGSNTVNVGALDDDNRSNNKMFTKSNCSC
ncbi:hypothetical protein GJ496_001462 [Pomphorhynchus laevis]|nr:hypothetical protein GJ496_001462 [Pomphorhynchus laevis]